jgi:transcription elongation factor Elf1
MAKTKRGKGLWNLPSRGRGTCPICGSTRIKLLYSRTKSDGTQVKVCKKCDNAPQTRIDASAG